LSEAGEREAGLSVDAVRDDLGAVSLVRLRTVHADRVAKRVGLTGMPVGRERVELGHRAFLGERGDRQRKKRERGDQDRDETP